MLHLKRHYRVLICLAFLVAIVLPGHAARAQAPLCFTETGACIEGQFRTYWEQNGGLAVFGYPTTTARPERNRETGKEYLTQWFQRNRFELHPELPAPYDILLGRLGDDRLRQSGVDWQALPRESGATAGCLWFPQTGHNVCDQEPGVGFLSYWRSHGLTDTRLDAFGRSLALFGLPLTGVKVETNSSGDAVQTQWFERARFEWHPGKPVEFRVLLGLLGNEVRSGGSGQPEAAPLQYVALGDSLATGVLANSGYVPRYRDYAQSATGRSVTLTNLGRNGWTSAQLLNALRSDPTFREAVSRADILTWDIGGNDINDARRAYRARNCGGADNQDCLRRTLAAFKSNWDAILAELQALRPASTTVRRTMDVYNPYVDEDRAADSWADDGGRNDFAAFKPYIDEGNAHIRATAAARGIPCAQVYAAFNGSAGDQDPSARGWITVDGLHPSDAGHQRIAELLRDLGFAPIK